MIKIVQNIFSLIIPIFLSGCFDEAKEIQDARKIASISFDENKLSQLIYYEKTNFVCGIKTEDKLSDKKGNARKIIIDLKTSKLILEPNTERPEPPKVSSNPTVQQYNEDLKNTLLWTKKIDSRMREIEIFDSKYNYNCSHEPLKENKIVESKIADSIEYNFVYTNEIINIPDNFTGTDLSSIANKVKEATKDKIITETTTEYEKRLSVIIFDPSPLNFNTNYALRIGRPGSAASYDADKETITIYYKDICIDNVIHTYKKSKPVICDIANQVKISMVNSNKFFGKIILNNNRDIEYSSWKGLTYDLKDSFKVNKNKISELSLTDDGKYIDVKTIFVGNIVKDQINPAFTSKDSPIDFNPSRKFAVNGAITPFDLKYVIHYNPKNGEILDKKYIK